MKRYFAKLYFHILVKRHFCACVFLDENISILKRSLLFALNALNNVWHQGCAVVLSSCVVILATGTREQVPI